MRAYGSSLAASVKKIKKTHNRTKWASACYTFAAFVITVLAFFPTVNVKFAGENKLFIGTFFKPIVNIFKNNLNIFDLIVMVLYIVMAVLIVVSFFKCFTRFGKIMRRNSGNVTTCNKNLLIMEEIGNAFSGLFASYIIFNLAIYMMSYSVVPAPKPFGAVSLWGIIGLAVGVLMHFIAGVLGGGVSFFIVTASIEEKKREDKLIIFFLRNLIQVLAVAGMLFFFVPTTNLYIEIGRMFAKEPSVFTNMSADLLAFLAVVLQAGIIATVAVLIKHATAPTEYNLIGMDGPGMYNFRVFGIITTLLCIGLYFLDTTDGKQISYIIAGVIMLVGTVLDFIVQPRKPKVKEDDPVLRKLKSKSYEEKKAEQQTQQTQQMQMPQMPPQAANCCLYSRPCYPTGVTPQEQAEEQRQAENQTEQTQETAKTDNTSAESNGLPQGLPSGLPEGLPPQAPTIMEVSCPTCGKALLVRDTADYHRCPACGKVFQIRKGKKMGEVDVEKTDVTASEKEESKNN